MSIYHKHHIIPRHLGGTDDPSNLVTISIEQHAALHKQLWEDLGHEEDRIAWLSLSGQISPSEASILAWKEGCKKGGYAPKPPVTQEIKDKIRKSKLGEKNPMFGKKWSTEKMEKMIIRMSGKNNPFYGKKHSEEMKKSLSEKRIERHKNGSKEGFYGPRSEQTKEKLREANKKQFSDPIKKEKHRQAMIAWNKKRKEVVT